MWPNSICNSILKDAKMPTAAPQGRSNRNVCKCFKEQTSKKPSIPVAVTSPAFMKPS